MSRASKWLILLMLALPLAGCPVLEEIRTFTSADTGTGGLGGDGAAAEGESEGEGQTPGVDNGADREVVEPDVIRRVDNLLYVLNQFRGLSIVDLDTDTLLAQVPTQGYPRDLYFANGQAYVLVGTPGDYGIGIGIAEDVAFAPQGGASTRLYVVDVRTPAEAEVRSSIDFDGDLVDSRLVGDVLYAVTAQYDYYYYGFAEASSESATTVTSINVADPDDVVQVDALEFPGSGHVVNVNAERAFVATADWQHNETEITCLDITDPGGVIQQAGTVRVRGYIGDRYKLDAWNGTLRAVSISWQETNQVYVSTFDLTDVSLPRLAEMRLDGAEGETLFATRFDGPRAYVVTYLVVDPLFVIDLSDPAAPALRGALEVPGYSTHIEPQGDRLIALGVDDTNGQKVSVSIFDVSGDGAPTLSDRVTFGENWSWSSAYGDVKALTVLDDTIIVPFSGWNGYSGGYERLQFISYTEDSLALRGSVDLNGSILRSLEYGENYFGVTTEQVSRIDATDLDNPVVVSSVTIAENLVDFLEIDASRGVEIVERYDEGQTLVRTVDGQSNPLGEVLLDLNNYQGAYRAGNILAVVGISWSSEPHYVVALVDMTDAEAPVVKKQLTINVTPYYFYYGYYDGFGGYPEDAVGLKDVAVDYPYYYRSSGESVFMLDNTLVLRCFADNFDSVLGGTSAQEGLALVDLESGELETTIGLAYAYIVSLDAVDNMLYLGNKESLASRPFQQPMAAYYLQEIDVLNGTAGPAANVPGAFVQYDPATDVLTLRDQQWSRGGGVESSLETVRWNGDESVRPLDSLVVPAYTSNAVASGDRVYFDAYAPEYTLYQAIVGTDGTLSLSNAVELSSYYGNLIGARGDNVFVSSGYNVIAQYHFAEGVGEQTSLTPVSGYPSMVRFGVENAYFPLGYYGLLTLPL